MKKSLLVASVLAFFASMSFAQAQTAPMGEPAAATASAPAKHKKHHKASHKHKKHHKAAAAASGASK